MCFAYGTEMLFRIRYINRYVRVTNRIRDEWTGSREDFFVPCLSQATLVSRPPTKGLPYVRRSRSSCQLSHTKQCCNDKTRWLFCFWISQPWRSDTALRPAFADTNWAWRWFIWWFYDIVLLRVRVNVLHCLNTTGFWGIGGKALRFHLGIGWTKWLLRAATRFATLNE